MWGTVCLSGVEVSLETQNEILDLAAHHLGNISAEETLKPLEVLREFLNLQLYGPIHELTTLHALKQKYTCTCYNLKYQITQILALCYFRGPILALTAVVYTTQMNSD